MAVKHGLGTYGNAVGTVTPEDHKLAQAGLIVKDTTGKIRAGLFYTGTETIVSGKANMSYDVAAFTAALTRGASSGAVLLANDGVVNVVTTAAPGSNSRYDVVYVWQREYSLDGTDSEPVIGVVQGTAAASPSVPSLSAFPGAIELARILVPAGVTATNSGTTITQKAPFTAAAGGVVHFRNATDRDAETGLAVGQLGEVDKVLYVWDGSAWPTLIPAGPRLVSRQVFSGNAITIDSLFDASLADAYDVVVDLSSTSAASAISVFMRASGADYTTGNQTARRFEINSTATPAYNNSATATALGAGRANGAGGGVSKFTVFSPASAQYTRLEGQSHDAAISQLFWGHIPNTTLFTGMKIKLDGVVTGTGVVTVYALRKS